ncbi:hypothetical protein J6590_032767 [Homalodisca vitripennis]|nr:hypothetical protein J6590_032767 [Homalodisca vitripennis]
MPTLCRCFFRREDPRDAVIFNPKFKGKTLETLPENSIIGSLSYLYLKTAKPNYHMPTCTARLKMSISHRLILLIRYCCQRHRQPAGSRQTNSHTITSFFYMAYYINCAISQKEEADKFGRWQFSNSFTQPKISAAGSFQLVLPGRKYRPLAAKGLINTDYFIGTSSLRRTAQLSRYFPHLRVEDIRGNLNTRLRKLEAEESKYAAIVLALAGITRMDWEDRVGQVLESEEMLYAVGQGALAVECRENDLATMALLEPLHHRATTARVVAERSFLCTLGGGCSAPVAVQSTLRERTLALTGAVWSLDGSQTLRQASTCRLRSDPVNDDYEPPRKCPYREPRLFVGVAQGLLSPRDLEAAEKLGADLAAELIRDGALEIMCAAKKLVTASIS